MMHDLIANVLKVTLDPDDQTDHVCLGNLRAELVQEGLPSIFTASLLDRILLARLFQWEKTRGGAPSIFDYCLDVYRSASQSELKVSTVPSWCKRS